MGVRCTTCNRVNNNIHKCPASAVMEVGADLVDLKKVGCHGREGNPVAPT